MENSSPVLGYRLLPSPSNRKFIKHIFYDHPVYVVTKDLKGSFANSNAIFKLVRIQIFYISILPLDPPPPNHRSNMTISGQTPNSAPNRVL